MVVVLSALVLGLLIVSGKSTFDTATCDLKHFATQIVLLDRTLRALAGTWPSDYEPEVVDDPRAEQLIYQLQNAILALAPETFR